MAAVIVIRGTAHNRFSVFDQIHAAADSFLNLIFIGRILGRTADHGGTVFQDRKEVFGSDAVVFNAFHDQCAHRRPVRHVIEVCIHADDRIIVFYIIFRVSCIGMLFLRCCHLI